MCTIMMLIHLGVQNLPTGPLHECPCCAEARPLHSINIDFNFSLAHWVKCGTSAVQLRPPNSRIFLHDKKVVDMVAGSDAAAQADADRACSDFNAARVLARTSDKVSIGDKDACRIWAMRLLLHWICCQLPVLPSLQLHLLGDMPMSH